MNRLVVLAHYQIGFKRLLLLRWMVRVLLLIFLVTALANQEFGFRSLFFGLFFISLPLGVLLDLFGLFLRSEVGRSELQQSKESGGITYETAMLLARSKRRARHLWFYLLRDKSVIFLLVRLGVPPQEMHQLLTEFPEYNNWIAGATQLAKSEQQPLAPKHLFEVMQTHPSLSAVWEQLAITLSERQEIWKWYARIAHAQKKNERGFIAVLQHGGGIGRDWASGYTKALEMYASDITKELQRAGRSISLVGHKAEREKVLEYLGRDSRHNIILIGDEGIGKQRLIFTLASDFNAGNVPENLRYKHVYQLDVGSIMSGGDATQLEERLRTVFNEAATVGNVILIIPDFHLLVGAASGKTLGIINASGVLTTYLQSSAIQIIAVIEPDAFYTYIKPNPTLEPYLAPVEVKEIQSSDALTILEDEVFRFEAKSKHLFTYQSLHKIIQVAEAHVHDRPYPEKALYLMDEVAGAAVNEPSPIILAKDVERILEEKLKVPIGQATSDEKGMLNNLEGLIKNHIIGQGEAVKAVANSLRRARSGLTSGKRPIGTFLFLGPTGVGKTEMAKTIAELYYKNAKAFIRLDMSEYQTPQSIEKLVGTPEKPGSLTTAVSDQPFSVVLLDEIEKADQSVRNVFLQILDDGHVTDGYGKRVDFTNSMVIATSNAGAEMIRDAVEDNTIDATFKARLLDHIQETAVFSPEWINRFDSVVVFLPLDRDEIYQVAKLQVQALVERLKSHNIELTVAEDVYEVLIERGYDPQYGARPMRRAVQDVIETALAKVLLNDETEGIKHITLTKDMLG